MHGHGQVRKHVREIPQIIAVGPFLNQPLPFSFRTIVGLELGTASEGYPSQRGILKRELGSNKTRAVRCVGLQLDT